MRPCWDGHSQFATFDAQMRAYFSIKGVDDDTKRLEQLALFLDGDALQYFVDLGNDGRATYVSTMRKLEEWFKSKNRPQDPLSSFAKRKLCSGESLDAYVMDLKRLGNFVVDNASARDRLVERQFISGLPDKFRTLIHSFYLDKSASIDQLVSHGRELGISAVDTPSSDSFAAAVSRRTPSRSCYKCGSSSHLVKDCRLPSSIQCFNCGANHLRRVCRRSANSTSHSADLSRNAVEQEN